MSSFQYENFLVFCLGVSVSCAVWRNVKSLNMVSIEFHENVQLDRKSSVSRHSQRYMKIWGGGRG